MVCYAICGTELAYSATIFCPGLGCGTTRYALMSYEVCSTELGYGGTRDGGRAPAYLAHMCLPARSA
eukprot:3623748-Rhodomonas_salina.2